MINDYDDENNAIDDDKCKNNNDEDKDYPEFSSAPSNICSNSD